MEGVNDPVRSGLISSFARPSGNIGVLVLGGPLAQTYAGRLADLALRRRLPAISPHRDFPEAGGLMAYGQNKAEGAKPGDLPVEQPTKFELVINMKTAKALGLTIPPSLLLRADQVIE
jgi:putative ABC transport system substrate-binding protein